MGCQTLVISVLILAIKSAAEFNNAASFDQYLQSMQLNSDTISNIFRTSLQCPTFAGNGGRFAKSTSCAFYVKASENECKSQYKDPTKLLNYCESSCSTFVTTLSKLLLDKTVCDPNASADAQAARAKIVSADQPNTLPNFCRLLKSSSAALDGASCFKGATSDFANCGFLNAAEKDAFCNSNSNEPCCKAAADALAILAPANNLYVIFVIIGGSIAGIGFLFLMYQKIANAKVRPTSAYQPDRKSKAASKFMSFFSKEKVPIKPAGPATRPVSRASSRVSQLGGLAKVQVVEDYDAAMDDELTLTIGDIIEITQEFDDGTF